MSAHIVDNLYEGDDASEKMFDEISPANEKGNVQTLENAGNLTDAQKAVLRQRYGRKAEDDDIAPARDVQMILEKVIEMTDEEAMQVILDAIEFHKMDPNFPPWTMSKLRELVRGYKACDMSEDDWSFDIRTEASILKYHSPYPEVRSVTDPFDDPDSPCETFRAYVLGLIFMCGATGLNTFFSQRQPAISLSSLIMQLLLAPCGWFWARTVPDWHIPLGKWRVPINNGPWTFKEQCFATVLFTIVHGAGSAQLLILVQRLPVFFDLPWVTWGYEILISLSMQAFGFSLAGLIRRVVIYPPQAMWPSILPKLALNRALIVPDRRETINGWKISRYHFFLLTFGLMFVYFWIPNTLFQELHAFNWMTWITPNNYPLGMITGFYGGMGFSPLSTFDWNVSGTGALTTPFFSTLQQYIGRIFGGLCIIAIHWTNSSWGAYMPLNSNQLINNKGGAYNTSMVLGKDQKIDIDMYKVYGPPYWSAGSLLTNAGWYAWYLFSIPLIGVRYFPQIKHAFVGIYRSMRYKTSVYEGQQDPHSRMMAQYKEVPEWWYLCTLLVCLCFGLIATQAWPTLLPPWVMFAVLLFHIILLVPSTVIESYANVRMDGGILFLVLAGLWLEGNPKGTMVALMFGTQFGQQTDNFINDLKFGHYAKIPPRAMFRGQILSVIINTFIWLGLTNWMIEHFQVGSFCQWDNVQHMVCPGAHSQFALAQMYGGFGVRNMFILYPILPYVFLIAGVGGLVWAFTERFGPGLREKARLRWSEGSFRSADIALFRPVSAIGWIDPAIFLHGMVDWTGGTNLSYYTQGVYISAIFMKYLRHHYSAWWQKYNYLLESGFDLGVAISGIIQTLIFAMGNHGHGYSIKWWGNTISTAGVDFKAYNQKASLLPIPDVGYFGLAPDQYPMAF